MISKIADILKKRKVSGWQIRHSQKTSFQSFLALDKLECRRTVETESAIITVYKRKSPEALGFSSFKVGPADMGEFEAKLEEALFATELVNNQPFELPEQPKQIAAVSIDDKTIAAASLAGLEDRLKAAVAKEKSTRLSAAEFFADRIQTRLVNHKGLDVAQAETLLHTEFILLSKSGDRENEYINRYTRRFEKDFDLEAEVRQSAQFARDATLATLPKTGAFPVLLSDEPLDQLFNPLIARASARLKYNKMMQMELGQSVLDNGQLKGDSITLWSNGRLDRAVGSTAFDSFGTPVDKICLIEKNTLKQFLADKRYADYLGVTVTGELGNTEIAAGPTPLKTLKDPNAWGNKPIYHLQAFSAFEPNVITGAFSAEIRAGYEISANGIRPIKGGSVSGVLQRDLLDCRLASERVQRERVLVPQGVLFSKLTIAGE